MNGIRSYKIAIGSYQVLCRRYASVIVVRTLVAFSGYLVRFSFLVKEGVYLLKVFMSCHTYLDAL